MPTLKNSESTNLCSLLLSESVQFSPVRKKPMRFFIVRMSAALAGWRHKYRNKIRIGGGFYYLFCTFVIR